LLLGFLDSDEPVLFLNAAETLALWGVVEAEPRVKQLLAEVDSMKVAAKATDLDAYCTALKSELGAALTKLSRATRSAE
jgi:hypothetical protein